MEVISLAINAISVLGILMEGACVWLFIAKHQVRKLPFVFVYLAYLCGSDVTLFAIEQEMDVWPALVITTYVGYLFEAAAIWELACMLLNPSSSAGAAKKTRIAALCCVLSLFATYAITSLHSYGAFGSAEQMFLRVDLTVSIYRVLALSCVLVIAGKDTLRRDRLVTQVTSAFAVYAVCALLKHAFSELAPGWKLPPASFSIAEYTCELVWVILLANLGWFLRRLEIRVSAQPSEL